jgi:hypothetical protein
MQEDRRQRFLKYFLEEFLLWKWLGWDMVPSKWLRFLARDKWNPWTICLVGEGFRTRSVINWHENLLSSLYAKYIWRFWKEWGTCRYKKTPIAVILTISDGRLSQALSGTGFLLLYEDEIRHFLHIFLHILYGSKIYPESRCFQLDHFIRKSRWCFWSFAFGKFSLM